MVVAKTNWTRILKAVAGIVLTKFLAEQKKKNAGSGTSGAPRQTAPSQAPAKRKQKTSAQTSSKSASSPALSSNYPGDFTGTVVPEYSPSLDGDADPGEIVWTWVPYEDDYSQGKDRPLLVVGHDGEWLLGLMLTSKDKDGSRYGKWLDIGAGPWDAQGRDSEVRLDRIIRVAPASMRREGAIMDRATFERVAEGVRNAGH